MKLEYLKLDEILPADANPKDHDIGEIYMSIKRFGFTEPPVRNETTGKLVAGHGRLETLKQLSKQLTILFRTRFFFPVSLVLCG